MTNENPPTPLATGGTIPDRDDTSLARALSQPCTPVAPTPAAESCALCGATDGAELIALCTPGADLPLCNGHWNRWLDVALFGPGTPSGVAAHLILEETNR